MEREIHISLDNHIQRLTENIRYPFTSKRKYMKKIAALFCAAGVLLFNSPALHGEDVKKPEDMKHFEYSLFIGIGSNASRVDSRNRDNFSKLEDENYNAAFSLGVNLNYYLNKNLSILHGIAYESKPVAVTYEVSDRFKHRPKNNQLRIGKQVYEFSPGTQVQFR